MKGKTIPLFVLGTVFLVGCEGSVPPEAESREQPAQAEPDQASGPETLESKADPSEASIRAWIEAFEAAWDSRDLDRLATMASDDYRETEGIGKRVFRLEMQDPLAEGYVLDFAEAEIAIHEDEAVVAPIEASGPNTVVYLTFVLGQGDGTWQLMRYEGGGGDGALSADDLPDVFDPDGAYVPVKQSQY
ncbi:MAG TPA: nuclear transport factor 2 family protein [Candidatus Hydrogenedentes bacterium]|nr:nuclear transport factor 2 family protein [Candidatus Hydrogenedentota bacterium]